jgi:hypothetical protein
MNKNFGTLLFCAALSGCAGHYNYAKPAARSYQPNAVTVNLSKDSLWKKLIPAISKEFFVINNLDKESGLINVSYSGDPERYVDCGILTSYVSNARGERTYTIPGARANKEYELMVNGQLFFVRSNVQLEGRINITVEELAKDQSRVSAHTRYVMNGRRTISDTQGRSQSDTTSLAFNTGGLGSSGSTECQPTGYLEEEILKLALDVKAN